MERFAGKVAVVTGASHGIGEQISRDLARAGMQVVATARREVKLQELERSVLAEGVPGRIHPRPADLSKEESVKDLFQWVDQNLGGVSVLVNCASGTFNTHPVQDMEYGEITQQIQVGVIGVLSACREMVNNARKHNIKGGHIITINSVDVNSVPDLPHSLSVYCSAKRAALHFNRFLRYDLQKIPNFKLKVTSIRPGYVDTPGIGPELRAQIPSEDMAIKVTELSKTVLYVLACPPEVEIAELTIHSTGEVF